jgi:hypothetical protein
VQARNATFDELYRIMKNHSSALRQRIGGDPLSVTMPIDSRGLRVKVAVRPGHAALIPESVFFELGGETVVIPLEVVETVQALAY